MSIFSSGQNALVYTTSVTGAPGSRVSALLSFLRLLQQRYETALTYQKIGEEKRYSFERCLETLRFTEAFLEKTQLIDSHSDYPLQVAVLGPTQVGKSSLVNWILDAPVAGVSPLAGFTVYPQGFALGVSEHRLESISLYFRHYSRCCSRSESVVNAYDRYLLEAISLQTQNTLTECVLWDTPDFDSIGAIEYRSGVLRVTALADIIILVLSKEKYADWSVWDYVHQCIPLAQPILIVLNKIDLQDYPLLVRSLQEKWYSVCPADRPFPVVIAVPYQGMCSGLEKLDTERQQLLTWITEAQQTVQRATCPQAAHRLLTAHWEKWVAPIRREHQLRAKWNQEIEKAFIASLTRYQRDFLDHPHHYETFQRALAELLTLLEIPGIGGALLTARKIITWPLKYVLGRRVTKTDNVETETLLLHQIGEFFYRQLCEFLLLQKNKAIQEAPFWQELATVLRKEEGRLLTRFKQAVQEYYHSFQPEIEKTACGLYEHLQEHPALLNGLRATRVTADAAALAITLHTFGIGVQDFILAPAMLSFTSFLTESALGHYVDKAASDLKQRQLAEVKKLLHSTLRAYVVELPCHIDNVRQFDISPETLDLAQSQWSR